MALPTNSAILKVGDIRLDGSTYKQFDGTTWNTINFNDQDGDSKNDVLPTLDDRSVTLAKTTIAQYDVTVSAASSTGTATVPTGAVVLGIVPQSNQDQFVDSALVAGTTLTVTLAAAATADNVFKVTCAV